MISCFKKSVMIRNMAIALGVAMGAIILMAADRTSSIFIVQALYAVVIFSLCLVIGQIVALKYATSANNKLLRILNQEGDAKKFIEQYKKVHENAKKQSSEYIVTSNYLSNGYMALGDFKEALRILDPLWTITPKHHQLAVKALILNNATQIYLWQEDLEKGLEKLKELKELKNETEGRNPSVHQNLSYNIRLYEEHLKILNGEEADLAYIQQEIELSNSIIHKNNMKLLLAKGLLNQNKKEEAKKELGEINASGLHLFSAAVAQEMVALLK